MIRMAMAERESVPKRITLASTVYEFALLLTGSVLVGAYFVVTLPDLEGVWQRYLVLILPAIALLAIHPRSSIRWPIGPSHGPAALPPGVAARIAIHRVRRALCRGLPDRGPRHLLPGAGDLPGRRRQPADGGELLRRRQYRLDPRLRPAGPVGRSRGEHGRRPLAGDADCAPVAVAVLSRIVQVALEVAFALGTVMLARREAERSVPPGLRDV